MTKSAKATLDIKLADADPQSLVSLPIRIVVSDFAISIYPQGYGDFDSADGHGCPLFIELYQGHLRVVVFPDINVEDPKIIDVNGAKENGRRSTDDLQNWTLLEKGRRFHKFLSQINPVTGKTFTMSEAAAALGVDYATFQNLEALWRSSKDTRLKDEGKTKS